MPTVNFREVFFYDLMKQSLGYRPWIEIKPTHLANGFFSAVCGGPVDNKVQHAAITPRAAELKEFDFATNIQREAYYFWEENRQERKMLHRLFSAEKTVFKSVRTSSYSLSHANHITSDNHDREAGRWLHEILTTGSDSPAFTLLLKLLTQEPRYRNDELSVLTLPLENQDTKRNLKKILLWPPASLEFANGQFRDAKVRAIRQAFDRLGENETKYAGQNEKLDTLRRMVLLGCFSVYFHLINTGANDHEGTPVPILLRFMNDGPTLHKASIITYQRGTMRSIDQFIRARVKTAVDKYEPNGGWTADLVTNFITNDIDWFQKPLDANDKRKRDKAAQNRDACLHFFESYRGESSIFSESEALVNAIVDTLGLVLSSTPRYIAYRLGMHIGLLGNEKTTTAKSYLPLPDLLEVLVRATLPVGKTWTLSELAEVWRDQFGIVCGVLGSENDQLREWHVAPVNRSELRQNTEALIDILEQSGYAKRYADGVVLVSVGVQT